MNINVDYSIFIENINLYIAEVATYDQSIESNKKILKALKDAKDYVESMKDLNDQEKSWISQKLFFSLVGSIKKDDVTNI